MGRTLLSKKRPLLIILILPKLGSPLGWCISGILPGLLEPEERETLNYF